jgi:hypothetical protein
MIFDADCPRRSLQEYESAEDFASNSDMMEKRLKTLSRGLTEVVPSYNGRVVQFIHQSVKDFFIEKGLAALDSSMNATNFAIEKGLAALDSSMNATNFAIGTAHYRLSRTCIRYLTIKDIGQALLCNGDDLMSQFPLLHYATTSWILHEKQSQARESSEEDLLRSFGWPSEYLVQQWIRIYRLLERYSSDCPSEGASMLHIVSRYQLIGSLRVILQSVDHSVALKSTREIMRAGQLSRGLLNMGGRL